MKIAISSKGNSLDSMLDLRFGRAVQFIIFDTATESFEAIDNEQNLQAAQGAGIQAAQTVAEAGVQALITGHTGPKAFTVLQEANISIYLAKGGTVQEVISQWKKNKLELLNKADVESHWI